MNVLSLFDGISCGQQALVKAGIGYDTYISSEIEKAAINCTNSNFPKTVQMGDVCGLSSKSLPKIDLLIGGSPCQGFSFAGKQLNFNDTRSKLFFEYVRLLDELSPKYFLLENVRMTKDCEQVISEYLGVAPVMINSALFTAHDRKRLYWTNIKFDDIVPTYNLVIRDILDEHPEGSLFLSNAASSRYMSNPNFIKDNRKSCVVGKLSKYQGDRVFHVDCKASSLSASGGNNGGGGCNLIHNPEDGRIRRLSVPECARLQGVAPSYLDGMKRSSAYKALGNGWTVDVIAHIFKGING